MDEKCLSEIKARCEAATPGPWFVAPELCGPDGQGVYDQANGGPICEVGDPYPRGDNHPQENMTFIAHSREDVPALIAEVRRLTDIIDDLETALRIAQGHRDEMYKSYEEKRLEVERLREAQRWMSYGTCKRAQKRYQCPVCGNWDWHSPMEKELHRISRGKVNRYLCGKCYLDQLKKEADHA